MPEMDGFELCRKIKTDKRISHIPVILLTAKADSQSKIEGLEFGADDYISKPFDSRELQVRVKNLIEQRRLLRERFSSEIDLNALDVVPTLQDKDFTTQVMKIVHHHLSDSKFNLEVFAGEIGMSRATLHRKISGLFGQSPGVFVRTIRLKHGAGLLKNNIGNISEIAYSVGFSNPANFSASFRRQFGINPKEYSQTINHT
jgi:DNA-binding response OmpR family regulator